MLRRWVLLRHESPKVIKEKEPLKKKGSIDYFGLMNLSLASCSPAELASVSIQQGKNQFEKLYFKTVEKADQIQWSRTRKGGWRVAQSPILGSTITVDRLKKRGYLAMLEYYQQIRSI
jgi:hypothetical protein